MLYPTGGYNEKQMVRQEGLEPPRLTAPEPKSGVSTNFTTSAQLTTNLERTRSVTGRDSAAKLLSQFGLLGGAEQVPQGFELGQQLRQCCRHRLGFALLQLGQQLVDGDGLSHRCSLSLRGIHQTLHPVTASRRGEPQAVLGFFQQGICLQAGG